MGILDQVAEMRNQGLSEAEMSARLQEQGFTPKSINDAFNQEKIRSAVSAEDMGMQNPSSPGSFYKPITQEQQYSGQVPGLPGDMPDPNQSAYQDPSQQNPYQQDPYSQEQYPPQDPYSQGQYPQNYQDPYYQDPYSQGQEEYYADPSQQQYAGYQGNTDTMIEISEQIFAEKIKKIQKQVEQIAEFAALAQTKISNNNERIKRMESIIDKLQISILDKIGNYGKDISAIKKEMEMIEDSFTKVIPELKKKQHKK
jgi:hypothetical protein